MIVVFRFLYGMYAFGLEETNFHDLAEKYAMLASIFSWSYKFSFHNYNDQYLDGSIYVFQYVGFGNESQRMFCNTRLFSCERYAGEALQRCKIS